MKKRARDLGDLYDKYYTIGYNMAAGYDDDWFKFDDVALNEFLDWIENERCNDGMNECAYEWADRWTETDEWVYKVEDKIWEDLGVVGDEISDEDYEDMMELRTSWTLGYGDYMLEVLRGKNIIAMKKRNF